MSNNHNNDDDALFPREIKNGCVEKIYGRERQKKITKYQDGLR